MGFFSSLLGAGATALGGPLAGALVSGVAGQIGNNKASGQRAAGVSQAQQQALQQSNPLSVFGPAGSAVYDNQAQAYRLGLPEEQQGFADNANFLGGRALDTLRDYTNNIEGSGYAQELARLNRARAPSIAQARASLQSQLLNRGRLGVGVGGGASGRVFNPETAAQEEAILRMQSNDIGFARDQSRATIAQLMGQASGLFNLGQGITQAPRGLAQIGIAGRRPANAGLASLSAGLGNAEANQTQSFFSGLGTTLGSAIEGFEGFNAPRTFPVYGGGAGDFQGR